MIPKKWRQIGWYVLIGVAATSLLMGAVYLLRLDAYNDGVEDTELKWKQLVQVERERLIRENLAALDEAQQRIEAYDRMLSVRNETILELRRQAAEDPDADRESLGSSSVRRLNSVLDGTSVPR